MTMMDLTPQDTDQTKIHTSQFCCFSEAIHWMIYFNVSNETNSGCLGYVGDYTIQIKKNNTNFKL